MTYTSAAVDIPSSRHNSPITMSHKPVAFSVEDENGLRCVDIYARSDGRFVFKEFRRDPEDAGAWSLVGDYSGHGCSTQEEALDIAAKTVKWLDDVLKSRARTDASADGAAS